MWIKPLITKLLYVLLSRHYCGEYTLLESYYRCFANICLDGESYIWEQLQGSHPVLGWILEATESDEQRLLTMKSKDWWVNKSVVLPSSFAVSNV